MQTTAAPPQTSREVALDGLLAELAGVTDRLVTTVCSSAGEDQVRMATAGAVKLNLDQAKYS